MEVLTIFLKTYGISCGKTSVMILIESVLALEVGAAAKRIFNNAIMYWKEQIFQMRHFELFSNNVTKFKNILEARKEA